jgi:two-component system NarL family response regulator
MNVLIANDKILVREGLAAVFNRQKNIEVIAHAGTISEVQQQIRQCHPSVLLIDLRLDGSDTVETVRKIHEHFPTVAILMLSDRDGSEDIHRSLRAGARGYLSIDVSDSELLDAVHAVSTGRRYISPKIASRLAERMSRSTLTPRELDVMKLIVSGKSNKEIGDRLKIAEETVKYHVKSILAKLGVADRTQAATAALLRGIVHPQEL